MDEARRFLRYVTPGVVFGVQLFALAFVLDRGWAVRQVRSLDTEAGVGAAVAAFLASGGVGYLLSVMHHAHHNRFSGTIDHTGLLTRLAGFNYLSIQSGTPPTPAANLSRSEAWVVTTSVWRQRLRGDSAVLAANPYCATLTDLTHGAGAVRIGAVAAVVLACFSPWIFQGLASSRFSGSWFCCFVLGAGLVVLHELNYRRTGLLTQAYVDEVLTDCLRQESQEGKQPVVTYLTR